MSFGRYLSLRNTRKLASLEESVHSIADDMGCMYGHLPFDEAKCKILYYLNYNKLYFLRRYFERDREYTGFYNYYIVHENYFKNDFLYLREALDTMLSSCSLISVHSFPFTYFRSLTSVQFLCSLVANWRLVL